MMIFVTILINWKRFLKLMVSLQRLLELNSKLKLNIGYGLSTVIAETTTTAARHSFLHDVTRTFATVVRTVFRTCVWYDKPPYTLYEVVVFIGNSFFLRTFDFGVCFGSKLRFVSRTLQEDIVPVVSTQFVRPNGPKCVTASYPLRCRVVVGIFTYTRSPSCRCCRLVISYA